MKDKTIGQHIEALMDEEHSFFQKKGLNDPERVRLKTIQVELDRCWDLLRQRRAKREFGENPDEAKVRGADVMEKYEQ